MLRINNKEDRAEVFIYENIGKNWWGDGVSAKEFSAQLKELSPKPLDIRIDSGGGDVYEGFAICSAIQRYEGETTAYIDGMAASAASYIAAVCDRVVMNDYAWVMIHNAWTYTAGNAKQLEQDIARLNQIDRAICSIITKRSNLTDDEVADYMDAETWFTANDALENGICQEVVKTEERMAACISENLAAHYHNLPSGIMVGRSERAQQVQTNQRSLHKAETAKAEIQVESHTMPNIEDQVQASRPKYVVLNGKVYRKDDHDEH